jgi:hypothetical protein
LGDAKEEATAKAAQLARGDVDAVQLTGRDRLSYGRALEAIKSTGVTLDVAANEYAQATKTLAGHSLLDRSISTCAMASMEFLAGWWQTRLAASGRPRL